MATNGSSAASSVKIPLDPNQPFLEAVQQTFKTTSEAHAKVTQAPHTEHQYGPHDRQKLDLFVVVEDKEPKRRPTVVFIHGGGFDRGDKNMYHNIGTFFVSHGYTLANINYRLVGAHEAKYPSGGEDIALALAYLSKLDSVDPSNLFLFGTSAGAFHAATYLWKVASASDPKVAGYLCANLPAHFRSADPGRSTTLTMYLGKDPSSVDAIAMRKHSKDDTPCLMLVSDHDLEVEVTLPMQELASIWPAQSRPETVVMAGHNHFSPAKALGLGSPLDDWTEPVLAWLKSVEKKP